MNFVAASRPDSLIRSRVRQDDWRQGIASDKELMDRAIGKLEGTAGSAVFSTSGQLPTSAEIEEGGRAFPKGFKRGLNQRRFG